MRVSNFTWVFLVLLSGVLLSGASAEKTLVSDVEDIQSRNATTRIFNRTYSVPVLDAQFQPTGDTRLETRKLVEKADGLCYDAALDEAQELVGPERWEPTVAQFVNDSQGGWSMRTGPAKVHIAPDASSSSLISFTIPFRISNPDTSDRLNPSLKRLLTITMKGGALYYVCGEQNALLEVPRAVAGHADGNRIIFKGAFTCGDLEFVYEKGAFHQNVVIRNAAALPAPSALGLASGNTQLRIVTDIDDVSPENASVASQMKEEHYGDVSTAALKFKDASGKALCAFVRSEAWAESKPTERIMMDKSITVSPRSNKQYKHAEGVPYSYIMEKSAAGAVILDYQVRYGEVQISEAWQAGVTYWVPDTYTIGEDKTLAIEGGAIIKTSSYIALKADGGNILVKGTPFNYVLFTKESDNTVGETISYPGSNPYINFIRYLPHDNTTAEIQFAKFANTAWIAVYIGASSGISFNKIIIRDSIFRDLVSGIYCDFDMDIFNCLFSNFTNSAIYFSSYGVQNINTLNCTFDCTFGSSGYQNADAIYLQDGEYNAKIQNNIYTNLRYGVNGGSEIDLSGSSYINHDGTRGLSMGRLANNIDNALSYNQKNPTVSVDEYTTSPNGNYYLFTPCFTDPNIIPCPPPDVINFGTSIGISQNYLDRLSKTTIVRPVNITDSGTEIICLRRNDNWEDYWSDNGSPDIGFHYDIVHGVVDNPNDDYVYITNDLDLQPGVVIAINNSKGLLITGSNVTFKSNGLPNKRIRFIGINATCDKLRDPYKFTPPEGPLGFVVVGGASMECDFTEFSFL
ncbi:MAG: right-handed parallel beta-helix repeat-containing protein, partial [Candidatus Sumerlaeota bacterium]|nr:right-handed parallel beta-helix repeat-containing protein [Candidatus Sumerlaeota bacterium]